jgi:excisionase family DNA binding protein
MCSAAWRERATITVPEYAAIMGVGRNTAYEAVRAGEVHTVRVRGRILVSVPALLRQLGEAPLPAQPDS